MAWAFKEGKRRGRENNRDGGVPAGLTGKPRAIIKGGKANAPENKNKETKQTTKKREKNPKKHKKKKGKKKRTNPR